MFTESFLGGDPGPPPSDYLIVSCSLPLTGVNTFPLHLSAPHTT